MIAAIAGDVGGAGIVAGIAFVAGDGIAGDRSDVLLTVAEHAQPRQQQAGLRGLCRTAGVGLGIAQVEEDIDEITRQDAVSGADQFVHRDGQRAFAGAQLQRESLCQGAAADGGALGDVLHRHLADHGRDAGGSTGYRRGPLRKAHSIGRDRFTGRQSCHRLYHGDRLGFALRNRGNRGRRGLLAPDHQGDHRQQHGQPDQGDGSDAGQLEHGTVSCADGQLPLPRSSWATATLRMGACITHL